MSHTVLLLLAVWLLWPLGLFLYQDHRVAKKER